MTDARKFVAVRLNPAALARVDAIAGEQHDGNRSAAIRDLLRLGLAAWNRGAR
jgi:metal-responsive CopG/Arc/MetJ family transcriptional regulator